MKLRLEIISRIEQPVVVGMNGVESNAAHSAGILDERKQLVARDEETGIDVIVGVYVGRLPMNNLDVVIDGANLVGDILRVPLYTSGVSGRSAAPSPRNIMLRPAR